MYRTVNELTRAELDELKEALIDRYGEDLLSAVNSIPDDVIYREYAGIMFSLDDFFCNYY